MMIGQTVSHYKILEKLGEGGMGVVYKAQDTKLDREVALKFLPTNTLASDEEKARFEQEAKAAAKLSHANIATVHAIDEADGQTFIAMEYVDGETLSDRVEKRPLKIKDALKIAKQIAEGLHTAHEQGIVHRDIKSSNIMLTSKGTVKIMDFGLAKLSKASMMTKAGTTLGTISYMSPEQTQGEKVDHRSDIWSLGVVLYEMVSGQMPFRGDYESAIIYSIMNEEPEPLTAMRTGVPMELERIVNKLLAKEPGLRYQNIVELPVDLSNVTLQDTGTSKIGSSAISGAIRQEKTVKVEVKYSFQTLLKAAALIIPAVLLTWFLKPGPPPPQPKPLKSMVVSLPEDANLFQSAWNRMAISPDGGDIVHVGLASGPILFLKRAHAFEVEALEIMGQARVPFFSPDGRWIGFINQQTGDIYKFLVDGGDPLQIASEVSDQSSATWAPDNTIIFSGDGVLKQVSDSGGSEPTVLTKAKSADEVHLYPHMLPDNKTVLFTVAPQDAELNRYRLALYSFGDEDYRIILDEEGYNAAYSRSGHILYGRSNRLMGVAFDLKNLKITGVPAPILNDVSTHPETGSMSYALSNEGTIAYVPGTDVDQGRSVINVDLSGRETGFMDVRRQFDYARYSPDGKYVAFRIEEQDIENLWIYNVDGGALSQLTFFRDSDVNTLAWSPDSKSIAYATKAEDSTNSIYIKSKDGTGTPQKVYTSPRETSINVKSWSSDGQYLLFDQINRELSWDLFVYSFNDSTAKPYFSTPALEVEPQFSPNGKWIAYMSNESNANEVYVRPFPEITGGLWKISNGGGEKPLWSPDGKKIYYRRGNEMYSVDVTTTELFSKGDPEKIFEWNHFFRRARRFDIHPDGDTFIMISRGNVQRSQDIFVIMNFFEELKRVAPVEQN